MSAELPPVDLLFIWHHHQPDYRSPRDGCALLPWVRLHATKDYLDMARRLERFPGVRATFNFVPSLLDQIEAGAAGGPDALFDLLRRPVSDLTREERERVILRCGVAPRHAFDRWPAYRRLRERLVRLGQGNGGSAGGGDRELLALVVWFLLAWLDPMFHDMPEVREAVAHSDDITLAHRDALLALHDRLLGEVIPAYRALASSGQVELSESAYYHPILPLLVDVRSARRARPDLALPTELFSAPEDAALQIERAFDRHARAFGVRPAGMWPPEGSVSPEAVELGVKAGARWLASDEGVLWASLPAEARKRDALYRPWKLETTPGPGILFFRDHELSDRIGFVYHHWEPAQAVADFVGRLRRIAAEHPGPGAPVVSVILDGENCWEHYADDGGPFLDLLYSALESSPDIRTRTPSEVIAGADSISTLPRLHSGSWIGADFHIWIGHPEKNRAWDLLSRARRALVERQNAGEGDAEAWEALYAAEGSDWFWWFGEDHYTPDKDVFDRLFREHLRGAYERAGLTAPGWLDVPVAAWDGRRDQERRPTALIHPTIDGRRTGFYEWHGAGHYRLNGGGSSMHRAPGLVGDLYFGFDLARLYVRLDFATGSAPGPEWDLELEILAPAPSRVTVRGLEPGWRAVQWTVDSREVQDARCHVESILEIGLTFESLGLKAGDVVEMLGHLLHDHRVIETLPRDEVLHFAVPDQNYETAMWSV